MAYDPLKALQSAGVLGDEMPEPVKKAIAGLTQDEVDLIISAKTSKSDSCRPGPWIPPVATPKSGEVGIMCACGLWSGSGGGTT